MKRPFAPLRSRRAFTLIELLAVMVIILILAGLILGISGSAQYKSSLSRADSEIKAMETACENYKSDNGAYPRDTMATDSLDPRSTSNLDPNSTSYQAASHFLYKQLSGTDTENKNAVSKGYMTFTPGQLSTGTAAPSSQTYIIDPFGFSYGYSTANTADSTKGYNPTFDLWSTAGYSTSGKTYPTTPTGQTQASFDATLWRKNW